MINQEELTKVLNYDRETGAFRWIVSNGRGVCVGDVAGCHDSHGYRIIKFNKKIYKAHRLAWLYVYGYFPENDIDHINRVRDDNRLSNLREVSRQCNARNTKLSSTNTSGVTGVKVQRGKYWCAYIKINLHDNHLYCGESFSEAVLHRLAAEQCLDWDGCDSSSPAYKYYLENVKCQKLESRQEAVSVK